VGTHECDGGAICHRRRFQACRCVSQSPTAPPRGVSRLASLGPHDEHRHPTSQGVQNLPSPQHRPATTRAAISCALRSGCRRNVRLERRRAVMPRYSARRSTRGLRGLPAATDAVVADSSGRPRPRRRKKGKNYDVELQAGGAGHVSGDRRNARSARLRSLATRMRRVSGGRRRDRAGPSPIAVEPEEVHYERTRRRDPPSSAATGVVTAGGRQQVSASFSYPRTTRSNMRRGASRRTSAASSPVFALGDAEVQALSKRPGRRSSTARRDSAATLGARSRRRIHRDRIADAPRRRLRDGPPVNSRRGKPLR